MSKNNCVGIECMDPNTDFSGLVAFDDIFHDELAEAKSITYTDDDYAEDDGGRGSFVPEETSTAATKPWSTTNTVVNNYYASIGVSLLILLVLFYLTYCCRKDKNGKERQETIIAEDTGIQLGDADADEPFPTIT